MSLGCYEVFQSFNHLPTILNIGYTFVQIFRAKSHNHIRFFHPGVTCITYFSTPYNDQKAKKWPKGPKKDQRTKKDRMTKLLKAHLLAPFLPPLYASSILSALSRSLLWSGSCQEHDESITCFFFQHALDILVFQCSYWQLWLFEYELKAGV